jgi:4-methoxybenzoate monooxygenase (O-demethylating)
MDTTVDRPVSAIDPFSDAFLRDPYPHHEAPRRWDKPDTFDVRRRATGHMTFGTGIHGCVGQAVARLESEAIFGALTKRVASFELTGEPARRLNNTLRGLDTLPLRIVPV